MPHRTPVRASWRFTCSRGLSRPGTALAFDDFSAPKYVFALRQFDDGRPLQRPRFDEKALWFGDGGGRIASLKVESLWFLPLHIPQREQFSNGKFAGDASDFGLVFLGLSLSDSSSPRGFSLMLLHKPRLAALLLGFAISLAIELLQYFLSTRKFRHDRSAYEHN